MYKIGQVSALCNISIQALRYYDRIGLLKPSQQKDDNGYRFYTNKEIQILRIIQDLKDLGFSLNEIKQLLRNQEKSLLKNELKHKQKEMELKLTSITSSLELVKNRIENMDLVSDFSSPFEDSIEIKRLPERTVSFVRSISSCLHENLVIRFYELDNLVKVQNFKPCGFRMAVYHDYLNGFNPFDCDLEVCIEIDPVNINQENSSFTRVIPSGLYATAIYSGEYTGQCDMLVKWINKKQYEITGPGLEIYINSFMNTKFPKNYITEVQFPVKKALTL